MDSRDQPARGRRFPDLARRLKDRQFVAVRMVDATLLAIATLFIPQLGSSRFLAAGVLVGLHLPLVAAIERFAPGPRRPAWHVLADLSAAIVFVSIAPAAYHAALIVIVATLVIGRAALNLPALVASTAFVAAAFAYIGRSAGVADWLAVVVAFLVVMPSVEVYFRALDRWRLQTGRVAGPRFETVRALHWELDARDLTILRVTGPIGDILGVPASALVGRNVSLMETSNSRLVQGLRQVGHREETDRGRLRHQRTGETVWFTHSYRRITTPLGPRITGVSIDMNELAAAQHELERFEQVVERSRDAILILQTSETGWIIDHANPAATEVAGTDVERGADLGRTLPWVDEIGLPEAVAATAADGMSRSMSEVVVVSDAPLQRSIFNLTIAPLDAGFVIVRIDDVTERVDNAEVIRFHANHDSLTGLLSRTAFLQQLRAELDDATDRVTAVALLDLDRFKPVNDTLGHDVGDQLLRTVGSRIREHVRTSDAVARLGGDEFAILFRDCDAVTVEMLASRLRQALGEPYELEDLRIGIDASIGLAVSTPEAPATATSIIRRADVAMYRAKSSDTGVEFYRPEFETSSAERLQLAAELGAAIDEGAIEVHVQPIATTAERRVVGLEALARWRHPDLGLLGPARFLDVVVLSPHRAAFTRAIARGGAAAAARLRRDRPEAWVSVNLDVRDLLDPDLADDLIDILADAGVPTEAIVLEVTEGDLADDLDEAVARLTALRTRGLRIAIDDFGTGHSSLARLQELPIDVLKLDQAFLRGSRADPETILRPVIDLAHRLGFTSVAEGVETDADLEVLLALGCDRVQGYLLSRPVPLDELLIALPEIEARLTTVR